MTFDLSQPFKIEQLDVWRRSYPFGSCSYCGCATGQDFEFIKWENNPKIRKPDAKQYDSYLMSLPVLGDVAYDPAR